MNRVIKENGFKGAIHSGGYLLGSGQKERHDRAQACKLQHKLEKSRGWHQKTHAKPATSGVYLEYIGWLCCEVFVVVCEIFYLLK